VARFFLFFKQKDKLTSIGVDKWFMFIPVWFDWIDKSRIKYNVLIGMIASFMFFTNI
jgi:hypothetical protein